MEYKIGGCNVKFPHKAYGTQLSFMGKVISALEGGQNALLEAPTGSGKTLSLLCSALAWQQREKQRIEEGLAQYNAQMQARVASLEAQAIAAVTETPAGALLKAPHNPTSAGTDPAPGNSPDSQFHVNIDTNSTPSTRSSEEGILRVRVAAPPADAQAGPSETPEGGFLPSNHPDAVPDAPPPRRKPPKIIYATRTHSQIAQVVRELKRSGFSPRMVTLASKQHYCVNSHARAQPVLEEACDDLMKAGDCSYFKGVQSMLHSQIVNQVHDIEDLCQAGKRQRACPYYASRKLVDDAELIFGPYNYFVDPVIRRSMGVDVEGAVIIFDEAHNIEDVSRESASMDVERLAILETAGAVKRAFQYNNKKDVYGPLQDMLQIILKWMDDKEQDAIDAAARNRSAGPSRGGYNSGRFEPPYEKLWAGAPMLQELTALGLGPDKVEGLWQTYLLAREEDEALSNNRGGGGGGSEAPAPGAENKPDKGNAPAGSSTKAVRVGAGALGIISRLIQIVQMLHTQSDDGGRDFRLVVKRVHAAAERAHGGNQGLRARLLVAANDGTGSPIKIPDHLLTLSLWCMNPAVAFRQVATPAHSIILTSGTLSPLDSFASELGAPFQIRLEAPHVVNMARQVWAGVIGSGPSGEKLLATYQHTDKAEFQDAVGNTVLQSCRTIPDGVLLFLPSYSLLDKLTTRWKATGLWSRLAELKTIVQEPRSGGAEALQSVMTQYYNAIATGVGGLFMAVCRGKVSEGLDFADANARGVLVVGIPFPNVKDTKVDAKRKFNDAGARTLGLLPGSTWYEQQAFRALNQAVGRCIRHRADWGAIVLIDERFQTSRHQKGLSRWLRGAIKPQPNFQAATASMEAFFARLKADPPEALPKLVPDVPVEAAAPAQEEETKVNAFAMLMAGHKAVAKQPDLLVQSAQAPPTSTVKKEETPIQPAQQQWSAPPPPPPFPHYSYNNSVYNAVRFPDLHSVVNQDLSIYTDYAVQHSAYPMSGPEARNVAGGGLLDCFDMALDAYRLNGANTYHEWLSGAYVPAAWGLQAVLATAPHQLPPNMAYPLHQKASAFGHINLAHIRPFEAALAMRDAYVEVMTSMGVVLPPERRQYGGGAVQQQQQQQQQQYQTTPAPGAMPPPPPPASVAGPSNHVGEKRKSPGEEDEAFKGKRGAKQAVLERELNNGGHGDTPGKNVWSNASSYG